MEEFVVWGKLNEEKFSFLNKYKLEDFFCYIDYKYMKDIVLDKIFKVKCSGSKFLDGFINKLFLVEFVLFCK